MLSKADQANLKTFMLDKIDQIFSSVAHGEVDPQIKVIFEDLSGLNMLQSPHAERTFKAILKELKMGPSYY